MWLGRHSTVGNWGGGIVRLINYYHCYFDNYQYDSYFYDYFYYDCEFDRYDYYYDCYNYNYCDFDFGFCSDFRYKSNEIFVLGVGFFSSDKFRLFN